MIVLVLILCCRTYFLINLFWGGGDSCDRCYRRSIFFSRRKGCVHRIAFSRRGRLRTRAFKYIKVCIKKRPLDVCQMVSLVCCGGWDRTTDLQVMSLTSCHCSTPRYKYLRPRLFTTLPIISALSTLRSVIRFLALF